MYENSENEFSEDENLLDNFPLRAHLKLNKPLEKKKVQVENVSKEKLIKRIEKNGSLFCSICCEDMFPDDDCITLKDCNDFFHRKCFGDRITCPNCDDKNI